MEREVEREVEPDQRIYQRIINGYVRLQRTALEEDGAGLEQDLIRWAKRAARVAVLALLQRLPGGGREQRPYDGRGLRAAEPSGHVARRLAGVMRGETVRRSQNVTCLNFIQTRP